MEKLLITEQLVQEIKKDVLKEFELLSTVYRPTFQTRAICDYIKKRVSELDPNVVVNEDYYRSNLISDNNNPDISSGNMWFDIPSNDPEFDNAEPIILQAHTDMVCTFIDDKTHEKMKKEGVKLQYHENNLLTSFEKKTSLGADNGVGVAIILAILKSKTFKHGRIRCILTVDEEIGLSGAGFFGLTKRGQRGIPTQGFKYLINNDNGQEGNIILSTAGWVSATFMYPSVPDTKPLDKESTVFTLSVSKLLGGHSGVRIHIHANAINIVNKILSLVNEKTPIRLINYISPDSKSDNVIHTSAIATFACKSTKEAIMEFAKQVEQEYKKLYPSEINLTIGLRTEKIPENIQVKPFDEQVSGLIIKLIQSIKCGVWSWKDKSKNWVETSGNIGPINLKCINSVTRDTNVWHMPSFSLQVGFRSCNNQHIDEIKVQLRKLAKDILGSDDFDYFKLGTTFYGWAGNTDETLTDIAKSVYESRGIKWTTRNIHAGLEVSWFKYFNPELNILAIGPTIINMHDNNETLHTNTIDSAIAVTLECITKMKSIKK